jgi:hypothetical protein
MKQKMQASIRQFENEKMQIKHEHQLELQKKQLQIDKLNLTLKTSKQDQQLQVAHLETQIQALSNK